MTLPINLDATYGDDATDASRKAHQQHHDVIHATINGLDGILEAFNAQNIFTHSGATQSFKAYLATLPPKALWDLQETSGTTAADTGPSPVTSGTYVGAPTLGGASMVPTDAADKRVTFNGTNQYVQVSGGRVTSVTQDWFVIMLINGDPAVSSTDGRCVYGEGNGTDGNSQLQVSKSANGSFNKLRVRWTNSAGGVMVDQDSVSVVFDGTDRLVMIYFDFAASTLNYVVNGTLDKTTAVTLGTYTAPTQASIGALWRSTLTNFFDGDISLVATGQKKLSASEYGTAASRRLTTSGASGTLAVNVADGPVQAWSITGNCSFSASSFSGWAPSGVYDEVTVLVDDPAGGHTINAPGCYAEPSTFPLPGGAAGSSTELIFSTRDGGAHVSAYVVGAGKVVVT